MNQGFIVRDFTMKRGSTHRPLSPPTAFSLLQTLKQLEISVSNFVSNVCKNLGYSGDQNADISLVAVLNMLEPPNFLGTRKCAGRYQ